MERDTVMICVVMDANTNWVAMHFLLSLLKGVLHRKDPLYIYHIKGPFKFLSCTLQSGPAREKKGELN